MERRLAAILAADVVGYTALMGGDEAGTLARLIALRQDLLEPLIGQHHGRMVKLMGDGLLVEFASVVDAVACALAWQDGVAAREAAGREDRRLRFRIGINLGDVIVEGDDIHGDGVNIAARLESLAAPGGICISGDAYRQVRGKIEADFVDLGEQKLKNVAEPVRIYRVAANLSDTTPAKPVAAPLPLPEKPSIAVLPFANMSGDPEQDYFAEGISEDLITCLSRIRWLFVIARNSTFVFKGRAIDVKQIARDLGVRYVLDGSVRRQSRRVRVTVELIDAISGAHHWADRYDREVDDIFEVQDDITRRVASVIEPRLLAAESVRARRRSADDLNAWELVARAISIYWRMTPADAAAAIGLLRQAADRYPDYPPAHSLLSFTLQFALHIGWLAQANGWEEADAAARRAVALDDEDPWAHLALGFLAIMARRTGQAESAFRHALELNPNFVVAHGWLGLALAFAGRSDAAIEHMDLALRQSPHDPQNAVFIAAKGVAHYQAGSFEEAVACARQALDLRPEFLGPQRLLCASLAQTGAIEDARAILDDMRRRQPNLTLAWAEQHIPYATPRAMAHFLDGLRKAGLPA